MIRLVERMTEEEGTKADEECSWEDVSLEGAHGVVVYL